MAARHVVPLRLSPVKALSRLRAIANDPFNIEVTQHAKSRMAERDITDEQVLQCLRRGQLNETPAIDVHGMWKFGVELYIAGDHLSCAVALDPCRPAVVVITAFWVR
jgi:hypothetical protein